MLTPGHALLYHKPQLLEALFRLVGDLPICLSTDHDSTPCFALLQVWLDDNELLQYTSKISIIQV